MAIVPVHTARGATMEVTNVSLQRTLEGLRKAGAVGREASFYGRVRSAYRIQASSRRNSPVLTGRLRADQNVETERGRSTRDLRQMGEAGLLDDVVLVARVKYARRQHEEHKTKAHFMLNAANEHAGTVADDIGAEYKSRIAKVRA